MRIIHISICILLLLCLINVISAKRNFGTHILYADIIKVFLNLI